MTGPRDRGVFVPAIMGAGVVFSATAVMRDLMRRSSRSATERRAGVRGHLVAGEVLAPAGVRMVMPRRSPRLLMVCGLGVTAVGLYTVVRGTMSFLRETGWLAGIGLLLALNIAAGLALGVMGLAAVRAASPTPPTWVWPVLLRTPVVGLRTDVRPEDRFRWAGTTAAIVAALMALTVSRPGFFEPVDRWLAERTRAEWLSEGRWLGDLVGDTWVSLVLAVFVGLVTWRCSRFARVYLIAVGSSLAIGMTVRALVDRDRPSFGPLADESMSFPSGHLVQASVLAVLVPLAVWELVRRRSAERLVRWALGAGLVFVSVHRVALGVHHASDVVAGLLLGLAVAWWAKASLLDPDLHPRCRGCAFQRAADHGRRQ